METEENSRSNFLAIIGDVVKSREVQDRGKFQHQLRDAIEEVNRNYAASIASRFVLTIGDEFQGLLKNTEEIDRLLAVFRSTIHPVEQRIGLGIGRLDTKIEEVALGMDGPCFHRARAAIEKAKSSETSIEVETGGGDEPFRIYALLYSNQRRLWTSRQREVFDLYMSGMKGKLIAERLGISPSAVSQHLGAVGANEIFSATKIWVEAVGRSFNSME